MKSLKEYQPKNIIVRMPNWIGDLVMATPLTADLRKAFPEASITVMVLEKIGHLLEADPSIDELFFFSKTEGLIRRIKEKNLVEKLKVGKYDLGILTTNSFSSAWRFWQGNVKYRIGFRSDGRSFLLNFPISFPSNREKQHLVTTYKSLLTPLGLSPSTRAPLLFLKEGEREKAKAFVKRFDIPSCGSLIGICPGAAYGTAKCWLPDRFREIAKRLIDKDPSYVVLFFGGIEEKQLVHEICVGLSPRIVNLAGLTDLRELMSLIANCSLFLTNDSGPMHIADSFNVPMIALFGSTDPIVTGPYRQIQAVLKKEVACSPCFKKVCPIDFPCMKKLSVNEVFEAALKILDKKESILC